MWHRGFSMFAISSQLRINPVRAHVYAAVGSTLQHLTMGSVLADATAGKPTEWPELVGQEANHAKEVIEAFGYNVFLVAEVRTTPWRGDWCMRNFQADCKRSLEHNVPRRCQY